MSILQILIVIAIIAAFIKLPIVHLVLIYAAVIGLHWWLHHE